MSPLSTGHQGGGEGGLNLESRQLSVRVLGRLIGDTAQFGAVQTQIGQVTAGKAGQLVQGFPIGTIPRIAGLGVFDPCACTLGNRVERGTEVGRYRHALVPSLCFDAGGFSCVLDGAAGLV